MIGISGLILHGATFGVAVGLLQGCAGDGDTSRAWAEGSPRDSNGTELAARGKARDVAAAISRSLPVVELAVLEKRTMEGGGRELALVGSRGEEGVLRVQYAQGSATELAWQREVIDMRLTAHIGRFGHAERERALVERLRSELQSLAEEQ